MKPHDARFWTPPSLPDLDPSDYPKGLKPGDEGFLEALLEDTDIEFVDETKKS